MSLADRIQGTPGVRILREFVSNSGLYPLFEAIRFIADRGVHAYLLEPPHYLILVSAAIQSWFLGRRVEYAWWQRAAGNRLSLGLSDSEVSRNTAFLQRVVRRLKQYSEWSLDPDLLEESLEDMSVLQQRRAERAVLFMDIRDFTHWSEDKDPEMVIGMLNGFYDLAERIVMSGGGHKPHFTGDEVMSWFDDPMLAVEAARVLRIEATALLRRHQLNSGGALHLGPVVEGLMGSTGTRRYGIVGDTVNTTARLCDAARPGEVSISEALARRLAMVSKLGPARTIQAKGKQEPLVAYPL